MKPTRKNVLVVSSGCLVILLLIGVVRLRGGAADSHYQPAKVDGPYQVEAIEKLILHDQKRNKDLAVSISFPRTGGPFPLIVFSHGAGGSGTNYFPLTRFWVTHGYVVIQPTHADSIILRREQGERVSILNILDDQMLTDPRAWENRTRDISFVLDSIAEIERRTPALKGKIDRKSIGVGGHSYGAYTSQLIGGAVITLPGSGKTQTYRDDRPRALLLLSPQGRNQQGLGESSWKMMNRPMMSMTGTYDRGRGGQTPEWRMDPFTFSPAGDKYHVFIEGANHGSFTGRLAEDGPAVGLAARRYERLMEGTDQKAIFDYIKMASLAFWDAYLKGRSEAKGYLKSDTLVTYSKGAVTLKRK